jgi:hypothetical protein
MVHLKVKRRDWICDGCSVVYVSVLAGWTLPLGWTSRVVRFEATGRSPKAGTGTEKVLHLCPDCSKNSEAAINSWHDRQNAIRPVRE